jgi:hypothetical protein
MSLSFLKLCLEHLDEQSQRGRCARDYVKWLGCGSEGAEAVDQKVLTPATLNDSAPVQTRGFEPPRVAPLDP